MGATTGARWAHNGRNDGRTTDTTMGAQRAQQRAHNERKHNGRNDGHTTDANTMDTTTGTQRAHDAPEFDVCQVHLGVN